MVRKLLVALVAPILLVAGCGDDDSTVEAGGGLEPAALLAAAPDAAAEAGSARMELTMTVVASGQTMEMTGAGEYSGDRARMDLDLGDLLTDLGGFGGEAPEGMDDPMSIVVDGTTSYLRIPMLSMLTGTTGWLSVTAEDLGAAGDSFGLGFGASSNPAQVLDALRGVGEVEELGTEDVRGTSTTRYRAVVDLAKAIEALPDEVREQQAEALEQLGSGELPMEVWIDDEGLVRRMRMDLAEAGTGAGLSDLGELESGELVMELFDYGEDIEIEVPPAEEVTPFGEVLGGLGSAFGAPEDVAS